MQEALPDDYRGRALALYDIHSNMASVVAGVLMLTLGDDPSRLQIVLLGLLSLGVAAILGPG